jgi:hypothetical protein
MAVRHIGQLCALKVWCVQHLFHNLDLVKKKDNSLRICVDYKQLNQKTRKVAYALPRIEEILDCLAGNRYFSVIDMKSGFHQIEILEEHKERTAFTVGPLG